MHVRRSAALPSFSFYGERHIKPKWTGQVRDVRQYLIVSSGAHQRDCSSQLDTPYPIARIPHISYYPLLRAKIIDDRADLPAGKALYPPIPVGYHILA